MREERPSFGTNPKDLGDTRIAPFLQPGESLLTNVSQAGIKGLPGQPDKPLTQYLQELEISGRFDSVRVVEEGAFDINERPVNGFVAVVVKFKPA